MTHHLEVREHEFSVLDIPAHPAIPKPPNASVVIAPAPKWKGCKAVLPPLPGRRSMRRVRFISSITVSKRIFSWSKADGLGIVSDDPLDPVSTWLWTGRAT